MKQTFLNAESTVHCSLKKVHMYVIKHTSSYHTDTNSEIQNISILMQNLL